MKAWTCGKPTRALTCSATSRLIASANCSCSSSSPLVWGRACSSSEETRGDVAVGGESSKFYMLNTKKVEEVLCLHSNIHPTFIHHSPRSNGGSTAGSTRPRGGGGTGLLPARSPQHSANGQRNWEGRNPQGSSVALKEKCCWETKAFCASETAGSPHQQADCEEGRDPQHHKASGDSH